MEYQGGKKWNGDEDKKGNRIRMETSRVEIQTDIEMTITIKPSKD